MANMVDENKRECRCLESIGGGDGRVGPDRIGEGQASDVPQ
jgi:hypothetical protein